MLIAALPIGSIFAEEGPFNLLPSIGAIVTVMVAARKKGELPGNYLFGAFMLGCAIVAITEEIETNIACKRYHNENACLEVE